MALFAYQRRFSEALVRGEVYFPGESVKKFGLQIANIEPVMVAKDVTFEWGELVALDGDGRAIKLPVDATADDIYGVVHRNATATYGVLSEQNFQNAPRLTLSVFRGGRDGEIAVPLQNEGSTPAAKGGQVYVRVNAGNTDLPVGGIETEEISGQTIAWTGVTFTGPDYSPFRTETKYTDGDGPTTQVVGIRLP